MDPAEIPQRVDDDAALSLTSAMDAMRLHDSATPADPVSKVLDDDKLLTEIMVRLGFPTSLVRATLVCKRWYRHGSNAAFLRRFRKLHPPQILGFYVHYTFSDQDLSHFVPMPHPDIVPHFVPMLPQPPELDAVIRRTNFSLEACKTSTRIHIVDFHGDKVFIPLTSTYTEAVYNPLCPDAPIFPQLPPCELPHLSFCTLSDLVFKEEGDILSYFYLWMESTGEQTNSKVHVYILQEGSWRWLTSITITHRFMPRSRRPLLVGNKIYIASDINILVLDLWTSSYSVIQLPQSVEYHVGDTMLSRVDGDSGVYLIHATEFQLDIWHHKKDKWLLVDTICLHELFANLRMSDHTFEDDHIQHLIINQVGKNVEFVFLQLVQSLLYLDIKSRTLRKVHGVSRDCILHYIHPFMMIWPPTFPALKNDHASDAREDDETLG